MFSYQKKLQYPVKIDKPNPKLASIIISQYGGPDGELGASLRYLSQRYSMPFDELKGLLTDIGTEWSKWGMPEAPRMHRFDSSGMHETPFGAFPYLLLDILGDADDIADGTILIFHTRVQDATAVRHTIKSDINLNSSFAKFLANICL